MRVDEALAVELERRGVTCTFSVPASDTMMTIYATTKYGMTAYRARHEHAAIGMADGYARGTGQVGVAIVGKGPGLTNGVNALVTASRKGSSVLVITGEAFASVAKDPRGGDMAPKKGPGAGPNKGKALDQPAFLATLGVTSLTLNSAESAVADFGAAFDLVASGVTVVVMLCEDVAQEEAGSAERQAPLPALAKKPEPLAASAEDIEMLADLLEESWAVARPVILAGRGAVRSGAKPDLLRIGDAIGALFATTLLARPLFIDHPYDISIVGTMGSPVATELISQSDLILAFGAALHRNTTFGGELLRNARIVWIDSDPRVFKKEPKADIQVVADAALVAKQLADELKRRGTSRTGYRTAEVAERIATGVSPLPAPGSPGALNPRVVSELINRELPKNRAVVFDSGAHIEYSAKHITVRDPDAFFLTHDFASVGAGQPIALGLAVARPDRVTVLVTGDGGFMSGLADHVDVAVRYKLPIIFVVLNDCAFGAEVHHFRMSKLPEDVALYDNPPFDAVARGLGATGIAIHRIEDIEGLGERLTAATGPVVIDCRVMLDPDPQYIGMAHRMHAVVPV